MTCGAYPATNKKDASHARWFSAYGSFFIYVARAHLTVREMIGYITLNSIEFVQGAKPSS